MNAVRLELIKDNPKTPPRLSRVLPAVLYNIVPESSYIDFCNKIDSSLSIAAADHTIRAYRLLWSNGGIAIWSLWFFGFFICVILLQDGKSAISDIYLYIMAASAVVCAIYMTAVRIWMNSPTGVTPAVVAIREIRDECEAMTNRTPHASFHVALTPIAKAFRSQMHSNPIACIEVSVSVIGFELARSNGGMQSSEISNTNGNTSVDVSHPAISTTSPTSNEYQRLNIV